MTTIEAPDDHEVIGLRVFVNGSRGGNPVPFVADADHMSVEQMRGVAARFGHESAFVLRSQEEGVDWKFRFFVPNHEMEMCGHATVGAMWALRQRGAWTTPTARIQTLSGVVEAKWDDDRRCVWISQPRASVRALGDAERGRISEVLDPVGRLRHVPPAVNAVTSRIKTLVQLDSVESLDALAPALDRVARLCDEIESTGLYPYVLVPGSKDAPRAAARQFPKSSGYPEDPATGIAAAALWGYLSASEMIPVGTPRSPVVTGVRQGEAMGRPSLIRLQARFTANGEADGCWLSGQVEWSAL